MAYPDPIRVFCGADRSQHLPFMVLAHSMRRHSAREIDIRTIDNALSPIPTNPMHAPYTEFSYARFAIPALCGHAGHAVYMDSDMLVFADIGELWDTDLQGAHIAIEQGSRSQADRGKHAAVMLLDCAALDWNVDDIVAGLGERYEYKALMAIDPLLQPGQMRELIPAGWNDLDQYRPGHTRNLHYTKTRTQPWAYPAHPHGQVWIDEVARMLAEGALQAAQIIEEMRLGFVRPSLLLQLGIADPDAGGTVARGLDAEALADYDRRRGFVAHETMVARYEERKRAIAQWRCEQDCARRPWLAPWYRLRRRLRRRG